MNEFKICPICGSKKINNINNRKWFCSDCGFDLYNNVASAVGLIILMHDGRVLFERRAKEPRKGFLALPGGFVDPDESAETAAIRECKEEIGVVPNSVKYVCSFPNTYEYKNIVYKTCDLFFTASISDENLTPQAGEVLSFEPHFVRNEKELADLPLAFESSRKTLSLWIKNYCDAKIEKVFVNNKTLNLTKSFDDMEKLK